MKKIPRDKLPALDKQQRYSIYEACAFLGQSKDTTYKQIKAGVLRSFKDGDRTYIHGSEIVRRSLPPTEST